MSIVDVSDLGTDFVRLVEAVETGAEREIVVARHGRPVARLLPVARAAPTERRIGVAKGQWQAPGPDLALDREAATLFDQGE